MPDVSVRYMTGEDRPVWRRMYAALFPEEPKPLLDREISRILAAENRWAFMAECAAKPVGFAEMSLRPWANGCRSQPVPFLEGIWVDPDHRQAGVGRALLGAVEAKAREGGFAELGSDVDLDNDISCAFHSKEGFEETERVIYFRKALP